MHNGAEMDGACTYHSGSYFRTLRAAMQRMIEALERQQGVVIEARPGEPNTFRLPATSTNGHKP